jgi:hypothetical protein
MTLHRHKVNSRTTVRDGEEAVQVPAGWKIADGSADDTRVCGARSWQCEWLVFANGSACGTAMCPVSSYRGSCPRTAKNNAPLTSEMQGRNRAGAN